MIKRTAPPDQSDTFQPATSVPGDATYALLRELRGETDSDEFTSVDAEATGRLPLPFKTSVAELVIPPAILSVLSSPDRLELIEVAKMLDQGAKRERFLVFYTPVGDIRCRINWQSCEPADLLKSENIFFVKMRSADAAFTPKSGAAFEIGFVGYAHKFSVVCLAPPQKLYPGVDLMCFLPQNLHMEKNGKLNDGAPSVVSGLPSDTVTENGEPVVGNERALIVDFDKVRTTED